MPDNEHGTLWHFSREEQPLRPAPPRPVRTQTPRLAAHALAQSPPPSQAPLPAQPQPRPRRPPRALASGSSTPLRPPETSTPVQPTPAQPPVSTPEPAEHETDRKAGRPHARHARRVSSSKGSAKASPTLSSEGFEESHVAPRKVPAPAPAARRTVAVAPVTSPSSLAREVTPAGRPVTPGPSPKTDKAGAKPRSREHGEFREVRRGFQGEDLSPDPAVRASFQRACLPAASASSPDPPFKAEKAMGKVRAQDHENIRESQTPIETRQEPCEFEQERHESEKNSRVPKEELTESKLQHGEFQPQARKFKHQPREPRLLPGEFKHQTGESKPVSKDSRQAGDEVQDVGDTALEAPSRSLFQEARTYKTKHQPRRSRGKSFQASSGPPSDSATPQELPLLPLPLETAAKRGRKKATAPHAGPDSGPGSDSEMSRPAVEETRGDSAAAADTAPSSSRVRHEKTRSFRARVESRPSAKGKDASQYTHAWEQSYLAAHGEEIAALNKARSQPMRPSAAEQGMRRPRPAPEPMEMPHLPPVPKAPPSSIHVPGKSPPPEAPETVLAVARPMPVPHLPGSDTLGSPLTVAPRSSPPRPQFPTRASSRSIQSHSAQTRPPPALGFRSSSGQARPYQPGPSGPGGMGILSPPSVPETGMQRVESAPTHTSTGLPSLRIPQPAPQPRPIQGQVSPLHPPDHTLYNMGSPTYLIHPQRPHAMRANLHHQPHSMPWTGGSPPAPGAGQPMGSPMGTLGGAMAIEKPRKNRLVTIPTRWTRRSLSQHYAPAIPAVLPTASMPFSGDPHQGGASLSASSHMFPSPSAPSGDTRETRERALREPLREPHPSYLAPHGHQSSSQSNSPTSEISPASGSLSASPSATPNMPHASLPRLPVSADVQTPLASQGGSYFPSGVGLGISDAPDGSSDESEDEEELSPEIQAAGEDEDPLSGPAGSAAASRRPPEFDTGAGKDSKTAWPWRHLTRDVMDTIQAKDRAEEQDPASSLVVHARFAVFAVAGSTILTAQNHKVKIFRAGTVRAEVAGITDAAIVPSHSQKEKSDSLGTGPEKIATVADTPGGPNRVTALCFLAPEGEELGRYAWVGTASGAVWELDVVKETRVAVNRMVHKQPILHIARLGRRMCIVDEGGKISIWTPARSKSPLADGRASLSVTPSAAESNVSLTIPPDPTLRPSMDGSTLSLSEGDSNPPEASTPGLLGTKAITQRVSVEGKCVPLLVGDQLWVASGGASSSSFSSSQSDNTPGPHKKHGQLHRSIRRSVRAAAGVAATATGTAVEPGSGQEFHKSVRVQIYNPFADDRPFVATMVPPTLPPIFSSTPVGSVTDAAIVPASTTETVFLSHTSGHVRTSSSPAVWSLFSSTDNLIRYPNGRARPINVSEFIINIRNPFWL